MKWNRGFTLIELLVVVAIIGILAAVGVTAYSGYTDSARSSVAKTNFSIIKKKVIEVSTLCDIGDTVQLKKNWNSQIVHEVQCFDGGVMNFFQAHVNNDLTNGPLDKKNPFKNGGIWWRNGKTDSGYAPECKDDDKVSRVYAVYPSATNTIEFCTCYKTPCSKETNRDETTISVR